MKRRGLSTVVGAVFFVVVMSSTISYVTYSMNLIGNLAESITITQDQNLNRQNEEFKISHVRVDNNEFNLTVTNIGTIPINITRMWAQNMTDPLWNQTNHQLNKLVSPGGTVSNIGIGTGLVALNSESYDLQLVTERGNSINTKILSVSGQPLEMILFSNSDSPLSDQEVTLLYAVKNNLTEGSVIKSLVPQMDITTTGTATATEQGTVTPASVEGLNPGETTFFEWTYLVTGDNAETITFNATVASATQGNFVTTTSTIDVAPVAESSINEVLGGNVGVLSMNFTSFETCEPAASDCTSDSTDWARAWLVNTDTAYIWRLNVTNHGIEDIILEEYSALLFLRAETGAGGNMARAFFIMKDSTPSVENSGQYQVDYKILPADGTTTTPVYFGTTVAGGGILEKTHQDVSIYAVNMLVFGYEDNDDDGLTSGGDTPYSQNLPFQALRMQ